MTAAAHLPHVWTRLEYERLVDSGGFHPESRVELVDGEILDMPPQKSMHATAVRLVEGVLEVHREPTGDAYVSRTVLTASGDVAPLHAPGRPTVAVANLMP